VEYLLPPSHPYLSYAAGTALFRSGHTPRSIGSSGICQDLIEFGRQNASRRACRTDGGKVANFLARDTRFLGGRKTPQASHGHSISREPRLFFFVDPRSAANFP
jgi:hypothetical protein